MIIVDIYSILWYKYVQDNSYNSKYIIYLLGHYSNVNTFFMRKKKGGKIL